MKKRIALALSMILMVLLLGACGTDPTTVDYNGHSYEDLQSESDNNVTMVQQLAAMFEENSLTVDTVTQDIVDALANNYGVTQAQIEAAGKWMDVTDEFGAFEKVKDNSFEVTKSGKTLTTDVTLKFEKKNVDFQVVYDYYSMDITGITVEPIYSLGEKMSKAALNTVISMAVVFAVLILISLLISCFKIFPYLEKKKAAKAATAVAGNAQEQTTETVTVDEPQVADDTELVAVIAAAIAASTGTSTSDFVVRSITVEETGSTPSVAAPKRAASAAPAAKPAAPAASAGAGSIKIEAGAAGKVFKIEKKAGDAVKKGDTVLILEIMKMETPVVAPEDGTVASIDVAVGDSVESGALLATLN